MNKRKPFVIGLVGGIAAGKSFVAHALEQLGAVVIDADQLGHQVLTRPTLVRQLASVFGESIIGSDGQIDRKRLAAIVFGNSIESTQARGILESIVHPLIRSAAVDQLLAFQVSDTPPKIVIIDAPLLLEANWAPLCDAILFIDCAEELRAQRAAGRGWSIAEFQSREAAQMPLELKKRHATHFVSAAAGAQELERQLRRLVEEIIALR